MLNLTEIKKEISANIEEINELCFDFIDSADFTLEDTEDIKEFITELFSLRDKRRKLFELRNSIEE